MLDGRCGVCGRQVMDREDNYGTAHGPQCRNCFPLAPRNIPGHCRKCGRHPVESIETMLCQECRLLTQGEAIIEKLKSIKPSHRIEEDIGLPPLCKLCEAQGHTSVQNCRRYPCRHYATPPRPVNSEGVSMLTDLQKARMAAENVFAKPTPHKTDDELAALLATAPKERSRWRHYKRNELYYVLGSAIHENTGEVMVVYNKWNHGIIFTRPLGQWQEIVEHGGERVPRYVEVE